MKKVVLTLPIVWALLCLTFVNAQSLKSHTFPVSSKQNVIPPGLLKIFSEMNKGRQQPVASSLNKATPKVITKLIEQYWNYGSWGDTNFVVENTYDANYNLTGLTIRYPDNYNIYSIHSLYRVVYSNLHEVNIPASAIGSDITTYNGKLFLPAVMHVQKIVAKKWVDTQQVVFTFGSGNILQNQVQKFLVNGVWKDSARNSYIYDSHSNYNGYTIDSASSGVWVEKSGYKSDFIYSGTNIITVNRSYYNSAKWVLYYVENNHYKSGKNIIDYILYDDFSGVKDSIIYTWYKFTPKPMYNSENTIGGNEYLLALDRLIITTSGIVHSGDSIPQDFNSDSLLEGRMHYLFDYSNGNVYKAEVKDSNSYDSHHNLLQYLYYVTPLTHSDTFDTPLSGKSYQNRYDPDNFLRYSLARTFQDGMDSFALYYRDMYSYNIATGIEENSTATNGKILLYPNPSHNSLVVDLGDIQNEEGDLRVYNATGIMVFTEKLSQNQTQLDVSNFPQGIYIVQFIGKSSNALSRFIKD